MDDIISKIINTFIDENPERIYLFGSRAGGTPRADSDYDICLIKNLDNTQLRNEGQRLYHKLRIAVPDVDTDFILYTPEQFNEDKDFPGFVTYDIYRKGRVIYERKQQSS